MKDYRDMLSSLKDKVIDVAGKATVAVTDAAGKAVSDEVRDKVAGAAHTVGERAKYASRMTRLTVDCNAELERVKRTYTEIGRLYYENYRDTADAFLAELCQQVTDANAHVAEMEAQMDELRAAAKEYLRIVEWAAADVDPDPAQLGLQGSPTKVKRIENVVFAAKEAKKLTAADNDINELMVELIASHTLG